MASQLTIDHDQAMADRFGSGVKLSQKQWAHLWRISELLGVKP